jgi:acetoin utilization protein AcuC
MKPVLIGGEIYRGSSYGSRHPLAIPRVSSTLDLIRALDWVREENYRDSPMATEADLSRFHDPAYIKALIRAEAAQKVPPEERQQFNIGCNGNPVFAEMFRRPATAAGGGLLAADLIAEGRATRVFNPAGGTHHGLKNRASGFCFFNEPVLTILRLLDSGFPRVLYLDLDAHHGDGVQIAFTGDARVLCISVHEAGRWPFSGSAEDDGGGSALNLPVPQGFHDAELGYLVERVIVPAARSFAAPVMFIQAGADALADDPLSKLSLSNRGYWQAVRRALSLSERVIISGGGGYNPWSVARAWAGVWGIINGLPLPDELPPEAQAVLQNLVWDHRLGREPPHHWKTTLCDPPLDPQPVRAEVAALAERAGARFA